MKHKNLAIVSLLVATGALRSVGAQDAPTRSPGMLDSAQMSGMMGSAMRRMQPAQFVLDHRTELALSPEQVPFMESLVLAHADSTRVRSARRMAIARTAARDPLAARAGGVMAWTGAIDEGAIREASRQQAEQAAQYQIDVARDRHAVGALLTPSQLSMIARIEASEMMSGIRAAGLMRTPELPSGRPYFAFQVDKQVAQQPGTSGPKYPDALRASGPDGEVLAQFVVDSAGHYEDGSFKVLKSSHALFAQAMRDALPQMRFIPAELAGARVRQLVQQLFSFKPGMK
ncbi:hypothetical protein BH11GEM2_BH11GEM2_28150 [soil metagenome]